MSVEVNLETHEITVLVDYTERGPNGYTPVIGDNGNWWINGIDTGLPSRGDEGEVPEITIQDGVWFIDGVSTGQEAVGEDGHTPVMTIGENGNWFIDGVDTGQEAQGPKGDDGETIVNLNPDSVTGSARIWIGTQAQYDNQEPLDLDVLTFIVEEDE